MYPVVIIVGVVIGILVIRAVLSRRRSDVPHITIR